jgi:hypothetical protein
MKWRVFMKKRSYLKGLISGILIALLATNIVFAATTNIKVTFDNIRIIFDGVEKKPAADSKPITYNGKVYVPLDFVSRSVGKDYTWDSKNKIAYVGQKKGESTFVAKTSDGKAQLSLPNGWKENPANEAAILSYTDGKSGVMVIREDKSTLPDDATIDNYCSLVSESMANRLNNALATDPVNYKLGAYPAKQFEIQGETQKIKFKYLVTVIEAGGSYYQLLAFSTQSDYSKYKNGYSKILNTFKVLSK